MFLSVSLSLDTLKGIAADAVKTNLDIPESRLPFWNPIGGNIANISPAVTPPTNFRS